MHDQGGPSHQLDRTQGAGQTQATQAGTATATATYNGAQELSSYSNSAANMSAATYNGDGLRTSNTITPAAGGATTQTYLWDTSHSIPRIVMDSTNAYIYGPENAPIEQVSTSNGTITYLVSDRLGSVRGTVNLSGSLTDSTSYDAWGNPQTTGGLASLTPFGYAASYTDATGLTYNQHRYYDPQTGQFISVDPLVDQTQAPYAYAGLDPVNNYDLTGECWTGFCWAKHVAEALWDGAQAAWHGVSGAVKAAVTFLFPGEKEDVYISDHAEAAARDEGLDNSDVANIIKNSRGRYRNIEYQGRWGNQIGWYSVRRRIFIGAAFDRGKIIITTVIKANRAYVNRLIRSGWR